MPRFARNVAQWMFLSILAVTDIVQNANILFSRNGLRLKCPNCYQSVTSTSFLRFPKNLTPLFYKTRSSFTPSFPLFQLQTAYSTLYVSVMPFSEPCSNNRHFCHIILLLLCFMWVAFGLPSDLSILLNCDYIACTVLNNS